MHKIAIISGKGGTGKTLVSTNLSEIASKYGKMILLCDADAEEPDSGIFFALEKTDEKPVIKKVPEIDTDRCSLCSLCVDNCAFSAIHVSKNKGMVLDSLCHGCGLCTMICPEKAIAEKEKKIGIVNSYTCTGTLKFREGVLNIGEPSAVPVIRQLKSSIHGEEYDYVFFDSPPGCSCSVVETLRECDYALAVTEPTPFGMHDLKMALKVLEDMKIPHSIILNRWDEESSIYEDEIIGTGNSLIARIPYDKRIAESYSHGRLITKEFPEYSELFETVFLKITGEVEKL